MSKILFLGGPSASGKSYIASQYLTRLGWLHIEIDRYGERNGIDQANLRPQWVEFWRHERPIPLHEELTRRAGSHAGVVLTFPSNWVFSAAHLEAGRGYFHHAYLYGSPSVCYREFCAREQATGRGLDAAHWDHYAPPTYGRLSRAHNHRLLIDAFLPDGTRRDADAICGDLLRLIGETK